MITLLFVGFMAGLVSSCVTPDSSTTDNISLHSPMLEKKWTSQTEESGLRYVDPQSRLNDLLIRRVLATTSPMSSPPDIQPIFDPSATPRSMKQSWKYTVIDGKPVRWYQVDEGSGADFPQFRTEPFAVTTAKGKTEYYVVMVSNGMKDNYVQQIDQMLRSIQRK